MLTVDLARLERYGRLEIDEAVPPDDPLWEGSELRLTGPVAVRLEARKVGTDVLVRGRLAGEVEFECRRCLTRVHYAVDEPVSFLYRSGVDAAEAEREEVYPLPERGRALDLGQAVREHFMLAVPEYVVCREACRGLCPRCGANLNVESCTCGPAETDERWAPLRGLKLD
jgi:uncharacterized protein